MSLLPPDPVDPSPVQPLEDVYLFPQHDPGPAHPDASAGDDPQHPVDPAPGIRFEGEPERLECAESIFFIFVPLHLLQAGVCRSPEIRISLI